ncbi:MAG: hypothetical protein U0T31_04075 [Chitinophagales bacterium]|nr:hypothetical protein [Chitinophagales bacterium]
MNVLTLNKINEKLKRIPDTLAQDVLNYLDYLDFKSSNRDWYQELSDSEMALIQQGDDDIKNGKTYSHTQAKSLIAQHIQSKTK